MKKEEANRINTVLKNIENIETLLGELLMPIKALQQKYNYTTQQAVNAKMKAEEYLQKYGVFTLNSSINAIKNVTKNVTEQQQTIPIQSKPTMTITNKTPRIISQAIFKPYIKSVP
jgi:hypothetical protein